MFRTRSNSGSLVMLGRDPCPPSRRDSEAERRERLGLLAGDISFMPNGTLDGFNHVLDFEEGLTHVFTYRRDCVSPPKPPRCRGGAQPFYLVLRLAFERIRYFEP